MTLQQAIDKTREELKKRFTAKAYKKGFYQERYCRAEIKKAFCIALKDDRASFKMFNQDPWYGMIYNAFIYAAMNKCNELAERA